MAFTAVPVLLLAISYASGDVINGGLMRSLRCLGPHSTSNSCRVMGIAIPESERLRQLYSEQTVRVRDALDKGNLTSLSEANLLTLHPSILYLIPVQAISELDYSIIAALVRKWAHISPLVHHLFQAGSLTNSTEHFLIRLQGVDLSPNDEVFIGRIVALWVRNYGIATVGDPLLAYLPSPYLYSLPPDNQTKEIHLLKLWLQSSPVSSWYEKSHEIKRTWSKMMLSNAYPKNITKWGDKELTSTIGPLLVGLSCKELRYLNVDNFSNMLDIFKLDFTTYQIRCLWKSFVSNKHLGNNVVKRHSSLPGNLTAPQITEISSNIPIEIQNKPSSLATARQILELCCANSETITDKLMSARKLVYSIPNQKNFATHELSLDELLQIDSDLLSHAQAFYLTKKGYMMSPNDKRFKRLLAALPVTSITKQLKLDNILYLLKKASLQTPLVAIKLLSLLPENHIGQFDILKFILKNPAKREILELVPSKLVNQVLKQLNDSLPSAVHLNLQLPDHMGAMLFSYNHSSIVIEYADCYDIEDIFEVDLPFSLSIINKRLAPKGMRKDLQECWSKKLVEYIHLKASFVQQYLHQRLFEVLSSADIEAAGGYVLAMFDESDILNTSYLEEIIYTLGRLSHSQLLTAAPREKFAALINVYLQKNNSDSGKITYNQLYEMGNLTLLLNSKEIARINDFRTLLESRLIDTRVCSNSSERKQWRSILLSALGPCSEWSGEELILAQNFMLVLSKEDLDSIPNETILESIDQALPSLYAELIPNHFTTHYHHIPKFYQVCMSTMTEEERASYKESLKNMVAFFIRGLTLQMNSVQKINFIDQEEIITLKTQAPLPESSKLPRNAKLQTPETSAPTVEVTLTTPSKITISEDQETDIFGSFEFEEVYSPTESTDIEINNKETKQADLTTQVNAQFEHSARVEIVAEASAIMEKKIIDKNLVSNMIFGTSEKKNPEVTSSETSDTLKSPSLGRVTNTSTSVFETTGLDTKSTIETLSSFPDSSTSSTIQDTASQENFSEEVSQIHKMIPSQKFSSTYSISSTTNDISYASIMPSQHSFPSTNSPVTYTKNSIQESKNISVTNSISPNYNHKNIERHADSEYTALYISKKSTTSHVSSFSEFGTTSLESSDIFQDPETSKTTLSPKVYVSREDSKFASPVDITSSLGVTISSMPSTESTTSSSSAGNAFMSSSTVSHMKYVNKQKSNVEPILGSNSFSSGSTSDSTSLPTVSSTIFKLPASQSPMVIPNTPYSEHNESNKDIVILKTIPLKNDASNYYIPASPVTVQPKTEVAVEAPDYYQAVYITIEKVHSATIMENSKLEDELLESLEESSTRHIRHSESTKQKGAICGALRSIGVVSEVAIDKNMLDSMAADEIEDCSDLLGTMELPLSEIKAIWRNLLKEDLQLKGSLVSTLTMQDIQYINFDLRKPWALETIFTLSEHNSDVKLAKWVVDAALKRTSFPLSTEALVAFGPYLCHVVHQSNWAKGENLLLASRILGRRLYCERPCLHKILEASQNELAYGPMNNWTQYDVESLGIIVAGMEEVEWANFLTNCPECITGLTKEAALCLPESHIKLIPESSMMKLTWTTRKALEVSGRKLGAAKPVDSISLERPVGTTSKSSAISVSWIVSLFTAVVICILSSS